MWLSQVKISTLPARQRMRREIPSSSCFLLPLWALQELKKEPDDSCQKIPRSYPHPCPVHLSRIFKNRLLFLGQNIKSVFYLCPRAVGHALILYPLPKLSTANVFFTIKTTIKKKTSAQTGSCLTYEIQGIKLAPVSSKTKKPELHAFLGDSHLLQELMLEFPWQDKQFQWEGKPRQVEVSI